MPPSPSRRAPCALWSPTFAVASMMLTLSIVTSAANADEAESSPPRQPLFEDQSRAAGLDFVHFNGMSGAYYFPETMGAGAALFDYDDDGDLDLYLVQGAMLGDQDPSRATFPPADDQPLTDRLFRNDLRVTADGRRQLRFTDMTEASGIRATGYGMGVATGDLDNDGRVDLYVTNFGPDQLWRNTGDGRFQDLSPALPRADSETRAWSVPASWFDYDRDGDLDLYVGHYVDFSLARNKPCFSPSGARDYCSPLSYNPVPDRLLRNLGAEDGGVRFEDVSAKAGIHGDYGGALGVVAADFNADRRPDVYVGNDGLPNQFWVQQPDGRFDNQGFLAGVAVNMDGATEASMGVAAADFDTDGDLDLFMTHLMGETNTLYVNDGQGWFEDRSLGAGLAAPSKAYTAFGTVWVDLDNDTWPDLFVANGDVKTIPALARGGDPYPLRQPNQLYINRGDGRFEDVSRFEPALQRDPRVSRGVAYGDLDNDGDIDLVVTNNSGPAQLLVNLRGNHNHWLGLRLLDRHGRDAIGAEVDIRPIAKAGAKPRRHRRRVHTDGGYASANDPRLLFGLGDHRKPVTVRVVWLDGRVETWPDLAPDRYHRLQRGQGRGEITP